MDSRSQLIAQINALHEEQEHQKIIALIERDAPTSLDYELTGLLARAYINYAQPYMDSFKELKGTPSSCCAALKQRAWQTRCGITALVLPCTGRMRRRAR